MRRPSNLLLLLALLGLAACDPEASDPSLGVTQQAIVNGTVDLENLAVGVLHSGGTSACTATVIGPRTLLTAAHCVAAETAPHALLSPINYYPEGFNGRRLAVESVVLHPDFNGANRADLAVVRLAEAIDAEPALITAHAPATGEPVELVGFGKTSETGGDFGTRRQATTSIGLVSAETMRFFGASGASGNLCNGDSGGPTFTSRDGRTVLIGVHTSKGGVCGQEGNDMRVDVFYRWIIEASQGDVPGAELQSAQQAATATESGRGSPTADQASAGGCSMAGGSPLEGLSFLVLLGLLLALRRRNPR